MATPTKACTSGSGTGHRRTRGQVIGRGKEAGSEDPGYEEVGDLLAVALPVSAVFPLAAGDDAGRAMKQHQYEERYVEPIL